MRLILLGISHRTAPVQLRERLALDAGACDALLARFHALYPRAELVALSTCNRIELYVARGAHEAPSLDELAALLAEVCGVEAPAVAAAAIRQENQEAVAHLFRVCAGLDSMVLGEPQILGQVKRAYGSCVARGTVGPALHRLFQQAAATGKRIRTDTGIDAGRVSLGSIAVDFARQVFDRFDDKTVVGIGAGEMAKLVLGHLCAARPGRLWITNRSSPRARELADRLGLAAPRGGVRPFEGLDDLLVEADIVVTATAAAAPILTVERFRPLLRRRRGRPLFVIDLAVPRDAEPALTELPNVYLYNLDDLREVAARTHEARGDEARAAEALILPAVQVCMAQLQNQDLGQLIRALRSRLHGLGEVERQRMLRKLAALPPQQLHDDLPRLLEEYTQRVVNKVLHLPLAQLDRRQTDAPLGMYAAALRRLFALETGTSMEPRGLADSPPGWQKSETPGVESAKPRDDPRDADADSQPGNFSA
jgi:glutamyl-tRNA reductase